MRIPITSLWLAVAAIFLSHVAIGQDASSGSGEADLRAAGKRLYANSCADCHGERVEGVEGVYETALAGDDSIRQLAKRISDTMPEGEPELCVAEDALAVANYVHYEFYSEAAQVRNRPPRIEMARLTSSQLRQSLADLFLCFDGTPAPKPESELEYGVKAQYFDDDNWDRKKRKLERVDSVIDFDFGREAPVEGVKADEFSILWDGG
ncbi:MAG: c-type cytochrome, partial [Planctomycetota bacterium]